MLLSAKCRACAMLLVLAAIAPQLAVAGGAPPVVELARTENEPLIDVTFSILKEAYRRIGMVAVEKTLPGERALMSVNSGEYSGDVMHIAGLEEDYPNLVRVPVPLISFDAVVFTSGHGAAVSSWAGLGPYRVCVRRGIKGIERATAGLARLHVSNQYENIFRMLHAGRCDVAVLPASSWLLVERTQLQGLQSQTPPLQSWPLYHYVHKRHAGLVPALSEALLAMQKNGYTAARLAAFQARLDTARQAAGAQALR